ncbi:hypothetical protein [Paraburkholderia caballeronis]|uniref:hypothetical protein n=1 Tax=Paraburkholderia caballeronis TaxID=416943 RepID=UPI001066E8B5|nr:hypothetical protein [Paraburkholderia caballeronis]
MASMILLRYGAGSGTAGMGAGCLGPGCVGMRAFPFRDGLFASPSERLKSGSMAKLTPTGVSHMAASVPLNFRFTEAVLHRDQICTGKKIIMTAIASCDSFSIE